MNIVVRDCNLSELNLEPGMPLRLETMNEELFEKYIRVFSLGGRRLFDITHVAIDFIYHGGDRDNKMFLTGFVVINDQYKKIHLALE